MCDSEAVQRLPADAVTMLPAAMKPSKDCGSLSTKVSIQPEDQHLPNERSSTDPARLTLRSRNNRARGHLTINGVRRTRLSQLILRQRAALAHDVLIRVFELYGERKVGRG